MSGQYCDLLVVIVAKSNVMLFCNAWYWVSRLRIVFFGQFIHFVFCGLIGGSVYFAVELLKLVTAVIVITNGIGA